MGLTAAVGGAIATRAPAISMSPEAKTQETTSDLSCDLPGCLVSCLKHGRLGTQQEGG